MTYLFKLSSRISRFKSASLLVLAAAFGCSSGEPADFLSPVPPDQIAPPVVSIRVEPRVVTVKAGDPVQFRAAGISPAGREVPVTVDWSTSQGGITADGRYVPTASGRVTVTARVRDKSAIADSAIVGVWSLLTDVIDIKVLPESTIVQTAETVQFITLAQLANGSTTTSVQTSWTSNGGTAGSDGGYTAPSDTGTYIVSASLSNGIRGSSKVVVKRKDRVLLSMSIVPGSVSLSTGQSRAFQTTGVWNDGSTGAVDVFWSSTGGTVSGNGNYVAGATPGTYRVIARDKRGSLADTAEVSISGPTIVRLAVTPSSLALSTGASAQLSASARMSDSTWKSVPVTWQTTGGTVGANGVYTAPSTAGTYQAVATATGTSVTSDPAAITVTQSVATLNQIVVNPSAVSVPAGTTRQFSATGLWSDGSTTAPAVTWTATGGGSITAGGLFTAGSALGTYKVIASASGKADTSDVTVSSALVLTLSLAPATVSLAAGQTQQFSPSATLTDGATTTSPSVTWSATGGTVGSSGLYTAGTTAGTYHVVATDPASAKADTSFVTISVPTPTVTSIVLSPSSATLSPGTSRQFTATATWSDGSTAATNVTYTAAGGTITSTGWYTAGSVAGTYRVIATQTGGTRADTSFVTVTSPPTVTSLSLSPSNTSVGVGGSIQFIVGALWSDGSTTVPPVTWSATGGTISSGGLYTAGQSYGTYQVTATQTGGSKVATASVVISPYHEPAGMTVMYENPFNSAPPKGSWDSYRFLCYWGCENLTIESDATAPKSAPYIMRHWFRANTKLGGGAPMSYHAGGSDPYNGTNFPPNTGELYVRMHLRFSSNWSFNGNTQLKFWYPRNHSVGGLHGCSFRKGSTDSRLHFECFIEEPWQIKNFITSGSIETGRWYQIEWLVLPNTPGVANGKVQIFVDGRFFEELTGIMWFGSGKTPHWESLTVNPTYSITTNPVPNWDMWFDIDNWRTSVRRR